MKKWFKKGALAFMALCLFVVGAIASGCAGGQGVKGIQGKVLFADENKVVMTVESAEEGATLKDLMTVLQEEGEIAFEEDGTGMIIGVNGKIASGHEFWALYTSASDYADTAWGTTVYEGATLGSAMLGHKTLPALEGEIYVLEISVW